VFSLRGFVIVTESEVGIQLTIGEGLLSCLGQSRKHTEKLCFELRILAMGWFGTIPT
jgi:hypothetical protein